MQYLFLKSFGIQFEFNDKGQVIGQNTQCLTVFQHR